MTLRDAAVAEGAELTIGVRPEHLVLGDAGDFGATGIVELIERLGESSFAYVKRADEKRLVVEIRGRETPKIGDVLTFGAALRDVHVFDKAGRRVAMG